MGIFWSELSEILPLYFWGCLHDCLMFSKYFSFSLVTNSDLYILVSLIQHPWKRDFQLFFWWGILEKKGSSRCESISHFLISQSYINTCVCRKAGKSNDFSLAISFFSSSSLYHSLALLVAEITPGTVVPWCVYLCGTYDVLERLPETKARQD